MHGKFPCVLKRPTVPEIFDLPKFNYEDLEEIVAGGQGSFGVYWYCNASRYIHTDYAYAVAFIVYSIQVFSSHDDKV